MRHLALVGPTASGKSALAVRVARHLGDVEIVTADSMQVYRGLDIGTATPTPAERAGIVHHLVDLVDPAEEWTLARWLAAARAAVRAIESRGRRALLVGGTGLYYQALVDGFRPPPRYPDVVRSLDGADVERLYRRLGTLDAVAAARIQPENRRRIVRALEVTIGSGRPFSSYGPGVASHPPTTWRTVGLWLPRPAVAARIADRFASMLEAGLVAETAALVGPQAAMSYTARQALGYREILEHLEGGRPLGDAVDDAIRRTRAFARRQRMWWRRDERIRWIGTSSDPLAVAPAILGQWGTP